MHSKVHPHEGAEETNEEPPLLIAIITYFGLCLLILYGYLNDVLRKVGVLENSQTVERGRRVRGLQVYFPALLVTAMWGTLFDCSHSNYHLSLTKRATHPSTRIQMNSLNEIFFDASEIF